ncbi:MAG: response regulator [Desulfobacterales bacterium]|nr:response regulator [Desulfobacterales bacterium]
MNNKQIRLLFVDDEKVDQMLFERFVKNQNLPYNYILVNSLAKAIDFLKIDQFDIVISDYNLGDGTAFELFPFLSEKVPIIIVTGLGNEEIAVQAMKMGAEDYLIKDDANRHLKTLPIRSNF